MRPPYLAHIDQVESVRCYLVDGTLIRDRWDVDFTNGGHHFTRRYVPYDEIWLDREAPGAGELGFLLRHQLRERALMESGLPYLRALAQANRAERRERRAAMGDAQLTRAEARARVLKDQVGALGDDLIWIVDGRAVRDLFDPNFTHGGHGLRYRFIPRRHIWIDDAVASRELDVTIAHEAHELRLMREGMGYDDAHERALAVERRLRGRSLRRSVI